jgi:ketosteroid isomerase-like protein
VPAQLVRVSAALGLVACAAAGPALAPPSSGAVLAAIHADGESPEGLRLMQNTDGSSDLAELLRLNADYVASVQASDVRRFEQILAPDFWCTLADGSFVDRAQFLEQTARPSNLRELQAHDVRVRIMGDVAIVHARTSFITADGRRGERTIHRHLGAPRGSLAGRRGPCDPELSPTLRPRRLQPFFASLEMATGWRGS